MKQCCCGCAINSRFDFCQKHYFALPHYLRIKLETTKIAREKRALMKEATKFIKKRYDTN